jgi:glycosyltransferase involved in cell wall biosynthesis
MSNFARPLRVLLYADLRTSHAKGWLAGLESAGVEVRAVSSQLVDEAGIHQRSDLVSLLRKFVVSRGINQRLRSWTLPNCSQVDPLQILETSLAAIRLPTELRHLRAEAREFQPDVVHALRIPYEGLTALAAVRDRPVVVSSWGQDFSLQAASDPFLRHWMSRSLPRAAGLHVDTKSDIRRAHSVGFPIGRPVLHAAGNFGVDRTLFYPDRPESTLVVYPRGRRRYVKHRTFLYMARAAQDRSDVQFVGVGLAGDYEAELLAKQLGSHRLRLTGELSRRDFAHLLRSASVVASPSTSDGTPNSILEGLSCGAYIMVGDVDSAKDFLAPPAVGVALDPSNEDAWVSKFMQALNSQALLKALERNPTCVADEYDRGKNVDRVPVFYNQVISQYDPT